jgi:hypothetical protein
MDLPDNKENFVRGTHLGDSFNKYKINTDDKIDTDEKKINYRTSRYNRESDPSETPEYVGGYRLLPNEGFLDGDHPSSL